jgi:uncharacterized protein YjbI with pentapeptide repeats
MMTTEQINHKLAQHAKWLEDLSTGERADLIGANLRRANLSGADLRDVNLSEADLRYADLRGADLRGADLRDVNLSEADLIGANLSNANLSRANLSNANLSWADLIGADFSGADLSGADLSGANTKNAYSSAHTFLSLSGIGSAQRQTLYVPEMDRVWCGCFVGSLEEFKAQIAKTYPQGTKHRKQYDAAVRYFEELANVEK